MKESYTTGGLKRRSCRAFISQLLRGRWFEFFAASLIMSVSGPMFSQYSAEIKSSLQYSQTTLNFLSFVKDLGANTGVFSSIINEFAPPWVGLSIGAVLNFTGYFMIWLVVSKKISTTQVWQMCLYICIASNSQSFIGTTVVVTSVKNFRTTAIVSGLLTGFAGLSGAIITQLYYTVLYDKDPKSLILLLAGLPTVVPLAFLPAIRIITDVVNDIDRIKISYAFYRFLYISLGLTAFLFAITLLQNKLPFTQIEYILTIIVVVTLLLLPIAIVVKEELDVLRKPERQDSDRINVENSTAISSPPDRINVENSPAISPQPERGQDHTALQALLKLDMLFLFLATLCGIGGALTAIDNLGQIGISLGYATNDITTCVSLVSVWNYLGRVVAGFLSEHLLIKYKFPRPLIHTIILIFSSIGHLLIAFNVPNGLYVASVVIGFCFGAQWSLLSAIISDLFGLKNYGVLYNLGSLASPIGSYVFKVRVTGYYYDTEANNQLTVLGWAKDAHHSCMGVNCFKFAFLIIANVTMFGVVVSLLLGIRTMKFYTSDAYTKFQREVPVIATVEADVAASSAPT